MWRNVAFIWLAKKKLHFYDTSSAALSSEFNAVARRSGDYDLKYSSLFHNGQPRLYTTCLYIRCAFHYTLIP